MRKILPGIILFAVFSLIALPAKAQEALDLEDCIRLARENNIQLKQAQNSTEAAEIGYRLSNFAYLPNLNFGANYQWRFGTTFSFVTFRRETETIQSSNPSLNSSLDLFTGMKRHNDRKKAAADLEAAQYSVSRISNDIQTNVIYAFLQVLFDGENVKLAESRQELLQKQLEQAEKEAKAGVKTEGDVLNIRSQLATENLSLINAENQEQKDMLSLVQLLGLDPLKQYILDVPDTDAFDMDPVLPEIETIFAEAKTNMPDIREKEARVVSAEYGVKSARAALYPSLSVSAGLNSSYSSQGVPTFDPTVPGGFAIKDIGYFPQLDENLGGNVAVSLNVPIFNRFQPRGNVMNQEINLLNAQLDQQNEEQQLFKEIQQVLLDVNASKARFEAAGEQVKAAEEAQIYAQKRFDAGMIDFYMFMETVNTKTRAESELLQAKYDFIMKMKLLDIYQGKTITFE